MTDSFAVDPDLLTETLMRITAFQRLSEALLIEIEAAIVRLHISWSGEAAAAHAEAHRHWLQGVAVMRNALGQLHTAGRGAHHNYSGVMATNQKMWS